MKYLLDTNILIYARKNMGRCRWHLDQHPDQAFAISVISIEEMTCGLTKAGFPTNAQNYLAGIQAKYRVLPFDATCAGFAGRLRATLEMQGAPSILPICKSPPPPFPTI